MTSCFFIYNIDKNNAVSNIWVVNDTIKSPLIVEQTRDGSDALEDIMELLEIENVNNPRFLYLGMLNMKPFVEKEFECFAIDVTQLNMSIFNNSYNVISIPAYTICNNENSLIHALMMKYILIKRKTAEIKKELNLKDEPEETLDNI